MMDQTLLADLTVKFFKVTEKEKVGWFTKEEMNKQLS